jgi:hypothetical protein
MGKSSETAVTKLVDRVLEHSKPAKSKVAEIIEVIFDGLAKVIRSIRS